MRIVVLAIAFVVLPNGADAQIANPGFMGPDTRFESPGVMAPNQTNSTDRLFAQLVTEGGLAEVAFSELATDKNQLSKVGDFARRMIEDHSAANDELAGIATKSKIPLPEILNEEHLTIREQLEELEGATFDLAYIRGQVVDHQKTTQLLIWEIGFGQDPELKRFASEKLPTILAHLRLARSIAADLSQDLVTEASSEPDGK